VGVFFDPWQAQFLADELRRAGLRLVEVPQTHASCGPKDTALWQMTCDQTLVLYDDPDLRRAVAGASAKELGSGLIFLQKAGGRSKIDLLVALSNCADEARGPEPVFFYGATDQERAAREERRARWDRDDPWRAWRLGKQPRWR
jgi:hypothetical protein